MMQVKNICKSFGSLEVLKDINLCIREGEKETIIRPSGSDKSTLILCLNWLEEATSGEIFINGEQRLYSYSLRPCYAAENSSSLTNRLPPLISKWCRKSLT